MGDLISRQDAIDAVKKHYRIDNDLLELIAYEIEQLPSLQPEVIACGSGELKDESGTEWVSNAGMVQAGEMHAGVLRTIPIFGEDDHDE